MLEICPPNEISVNVIYRNKYLGWPFIEIFSAIDWQNYDRIIALSNRRCERNEIDF